jgi:hypothetical protein
VMDEPRKRFIGTVVILLAGTLVLLSILLRSFRSEEIAEEASNTRQAQVQPSPSPTLGYEELVLPLPWPVMPFTDAQIEEVRECDFIAPAGTPGPERIPDLTTPHPEFSTCQWAAIAVSRGKGFRESDKLIAFNSTLSSNLAFVLSPAFTDRYFGELELVESPPFASSPIVAVELHYDFASVDYQEAYDLTITDANTTPQVVGEVSKNYDRMRYRIVPMMKSETIQALGDALDNLLPIERQFAINDCCDNYPDWRLTIEFHDGQTVVATTNGSNRMEVGGPWQVVIDGQNYLQYSPELLSAAMNIFFELGVFDPEYHSYYELFDPPGDSLFDYLFP